MIIHMPHFNPAYAVVAAIIGAIFARLLLMVLNVFISPTDRDRISRPQQSSRPPCDWSRDDE